MISQRKNCSADFREVFKGGVHECVTNIKYAAVSMTTVQREYCFALSEC